jgi:hypothetical protein
MQSYDEFEVSGAATNGASQGAAAGTGAGSTSSDGGSGVGASGSGAGATVGSGGAQGGSGGAVDCGPCRIPNGQPGCVGGECAIASCNPGHDDCNTTVADGCETPTDADLAHCGECGRVCSEAAVSVAVCSAGLCTSACALGSANCAKPATGPDDGCELDVNANTANCGGCDNNCASQGFGTGFECQSLRCRCTSNTQCKGGGSGNASCDTVTGQCSCDGVTCRLGESCEKVGPSQVCRCNGAAACGPTHVCCESPAGCKDLMTDPTSCGACGHVCAPGLSCVSGVCG